MPMLLFISLFYCCLLVCFVVVHEFVLPMLFISLFCCCSLVYVVII